MIHDRPQAHSCNYLQYLVVLYIAFPSLPGTEDTTPYMVEQLKQKLRNPDTLISLFLGLAVVVVIATMIVNYAKNQTTQKDSKQAESTSEQEASAAQEQKQYTVVEGDSLWKIAASAIGSGYNWVDIAQANKLDQPDSIVVGQKLIIPNVSKREPGQIANAAVEVKRPADGKYTVQKGESLWSISVKIYGTGFRWTEIATLNKLENPGTIFTGNVLNLP